MLTVLSSGLATGLRSVRIQHARHMIHPVDMCLPRGAGELTLLKSSIHFRARR